ncbi:MAG TPA: hypothetical protein VJB63_00960 [Patescibacteria group bacterium]|nr:hypothetical protein [Patescibacteria group bacterium]
MIITNTTPYTKEEIKKVSMENKLILESLASDLKRVALGLQRGSNAMARRFLAEALQRKKEVHTKKIALYVKNILSRITLNLDAEDALMYSTLLQNYAKQISIK